MVRSGFQSAGFQKRKWATSMCMGLFFAIAAAPSAALAADLYVAGALMNSFTAAKGTGEISLGTNPPTPLFDIN